jgi:hypothetical protein
MMRTQIQTVSQFEQSGKWRVSFFTYNGKVGEEYVSAICGSASVFDTEDEAWAGAHRALDILEKTGRFPNMCEVF